MRKFDRETWGIGNREAIPGCLKAAVRSIMRVVSFIVPVPLFPTGVSSEIVYERECDDQRNEYGC